MTCIVYDLDSFSYLFFFSPRKRIVVGHFTIMCTILYHTIIVLNFVASATVFVASVLLKN